ncbi:tyrosine-type recombinase/integrase [Wenzhouxiangella limi]|uniref:Tyrosine-type recombinase/integrase n=1 Tax=Wenzhouxiangella limi TaxID=2707351 RepID=A0A845UV05_9GAMM|nr:tyrosine-type recombinase/integrase [Wenzhouxiangella limi]NDY94374.1 tyrosine-type recombinase/integrase [Wenzhouxiangella limi]NDY94395.1 tyrosine-type recombinase/integrase [Wenzhouxiangella limi]NDY95054.1 tyrosine-type recombinase/integrase [Wenzhouxiangella limi]NDY96436.1 tyrosine-type recombinase/integrase [Wenzhouxiangella limi]
MNRSITPLRPDLTRSLRNGPLAGCEAPYRKWLDERGYATSTSRAYILCLTHFARWASDLGVTCETLSCSTIARFIDEHLPCCDCPRPVQRSRAQVRAALRQLQPALAAAGITFVEADPNAVERELERYDAFLRDRRGLAASTRLHRRKIIRDLLQLTAGTGGSSAWQEASRLRRFVAERADRWSPASLGTLTGALRSYLRYRGLLGDDVVALLPVIVSPAQWRLSALPETLSADEVESVLTSFGPSLPSWRRGLAIAQCVARLGLRSAEVVALELEDLDWDIGTIRLRHCKSRRVDRLPMPVPVGEAVMNYLRHERPSCKSRKVFVRHVAPVEKPLLPGVVKSTLLAAYTRCGLPYTRIHILRHSLAARVLAGGGTLKEVADLLRHRHLDTTQIYAKVDSGRLDAVAMPWPGSGT